ncbi:hypothetical protein HZB05_00375 [Candidatus Wolfebacteria bacterium]|nr:hypothetical protein [Candidatus Wolfebacteria bacterium]
MKKTLYLFFSLIYISGFVFGFYPTKTSYAFSVTGEIYVGDYAWICQMIAPASTFFGLPATGGSESYDSEIRGLLPANFPQSRVMRDAKNYSNWRYLGQTQESGNTGLEGIFYSAPSVQEPTDANQRTALIEERYVIIHIENSLCPKVQIINTDSSNFFNKKAYAQTNYGFEGLIRFTEIIRTVKTNHIGLDAQGNEQVKITVVPKVIQDNFRIKMISTASEETGWTPGYSAQIVGVKSKTLDNADAIADAIVPKTENILIVSVPYCNIRGGGGWNRSWRDIYCYRSGLSLDGRIGSGQWHYYKSGGGFLTSFFGNILNIVSLGTLDSFTTRLKEPGFLMPSISNLSTNESNYLLSSFAEDVIGKYLGWGTSPQTYNLSWLGTVSDSIANPTAFFGQGSPSDGNQWTWNGKFFENPTVTLTGPTTTVELSDKINLSWTSTNSDTCEAFSVSNNWTGAKATSGSVSFIEKSNKYVFEISCKNIAGTATSKVEVTVARVPRCDFSADPSSIVLPEFSTLEWDCTYDDPDAAKLYNSSADSCSIDNGIGNVSNVSGAKQARPSVTTSYNLTCTSDTTKNYTAIVSVGSPTSTTGGAVKEVRP